MIKPTDVIAIFGQRHSGKTEMGKALSRLYKRVFVIDIVRDWREKEDGLELVTGDFDQAADFLEETIGCSAWRAAFSFDVDTGNEIQRKIFNALLRTLYKRGELTGENVCLLIEEAHLYCQGAGAMEEWLFKLATLGRHANIPMIVSSQRPAQVAKGLTSAAAHKFIGRLDDARDLRYFAEINPELPERIQALPEYHFIHHCAGQPLEVVTRDSFKGGRC